MRQRVMGGVEASSVEDRQEAGGDVGQQLEGACEQEATVIGGLVEAQKRESAPQAEWTTEH